MHTLRRCAPQERAGILEIINAAAVAYRGVIPADCWHEPYMSGAALDRELAAGVEFWGCEVAGTLVGVMGRQGRGDVELIRHGYVLPPWQGQGVGAALLRQLQRGPSRQLLVGTWAAALWAIRFYERHGFRDAGPQASPALLARYWTISRRQLESSVVLMRPAQ